MADRCDACVYGRAFMTEDKMITLGFNGCAGKIATFPALKRGRMFVLFALFVFLLVLLDVNNQTIYVNNQTIYVQPWKTSFQVTVVDAAHLPSRPELRVD